MSVENKKKAEVGEPKRGMQGSIVAHCCTVELSHAKIIQTDAPLYRASRISLLSSLKVFIIFRIF